MTQIPVDAKGGEEVKSVQFNSELLLPGLHPESSPEYSAGIMNSNKYGEIIKSRRTGCLENRFTIYERKNLSRISFRSCI